MPSNHILAGEGHAWTAEAVGQIEADFQRSADTHLHPVRVPALGGIDIYLKDESTHPTGSLKHRLARSLFLLALCNGWIRKGMPVIEASSGSTAVSEAYFARMIGVEFYAVMPRTTSREKIEAIEFYGGQCHFIDEPSAIYDEAQKLAERTGGHFMDQFTYAERATDWRGNNNIAQSIFSQLEREPHPLPRWIVMSAGTGGTTATIGRYLRYIRCATRLFCVDVENSVFHACVTQNRRDLTMKKGSRIEGIGRPRFEPSFIPEIIDRIERVPDAASLATMRVLSRYLGRRVGGSTGTNFWGVCLIAAEMAAQGEEGSIVSLICDSGERYANTYYDDAWIEAQGFDLHPYEEAVQHLLDQGRWPNGGPPA